MFLCAMLLTRLLLFLCLIGHVFPKEPPDVDCLVVNLKYVSCTWNKKGTPEVNYTFYSWSNGKDLQHCTQYLSENSMNIGCIRDHVDRFVPFYTELKHGNTSGRKEHDLKSEVKLNPPTNLTVLNGSDFNLWFYWNHTSSLGLHCVKSEIRYRVNDNKWEESIVGTNTQRYCINLPSSTSRYELQVRNKIDNSCGESRFWSNWSEPVVWGFNNSTDSNGPISVWTPVLYVVCAITLILLVITLLHHERLRIILIPVVPKPSPILDDIEHWFQFSKGLKESFKANYNEHACPVREYTYISQSDSLNSDGSAFSVTTDQTDCSIPVSVNDPEDLSTAFSSSDSPVSSGMC